MELRRSYGADFDALKERLQQSEERANWLYSCAYWHCNCRKKKIEALENAHEILRTYTTKLTATADSEHLRLEKELQKEKVNIALQKKAAGWLWGTIQSFNSFVESLFSKIEVLRKDLNDAEFMRDEAKEQEALLATENSTLAQPLADIKKNAPVIWKLLPEYRSKFSSDIELGFW